MLPKTRVREIDLSRRRRWTEGGSWNKGFSQSHTGMALQIIPKLRKKSKPLYQPIPYPNQLVLGCKWPLGKGTNLGKWSLLAKGNTPRKQLSYELSVGNMPSRLGYDYFPLDRDSNIHYTHSLSSLIILLIPWWSQPASCELTYEEAHVTKNLGLSQWPIRNRNLTKTSWLNLEADPPTTAEPWDGCSANQHLDCSIIRSPEPEESTKSYMEPWPMVTMR